jgi:predicted permease
MEFWRQDVRYSIRSLAKQPGFFVVAVLSLAIGIAVNTAIFSVLNVLLLRPLPIRDAERSVFVFHASPTNPDRGTSFSAYQQYRARTDLFSNVMAFAGTRPLSLIDGDRRDQIYAELVTASFFSMADITVRLGRPFDPDVDRTSNPEFIAVLSHAFWQRRFASDPAIVGKTIVLNGRPFTAIGVAAEGFTGFDSGISTDVWIPMTTWAHVMGELQRLTGDEHWITTVAQLKPDVNLQKAQTALAADQTVRIRPVRGMRSEASTTDALLLAAGAFAIGLVVLTLACTNVANLMIARAAARQREMSVRMALGASRARLIRHGLTESLLLCAFAGALGILFASWILDLIVAFKPPTLIGQAEAPTLALDFNVDFRVLAFTLGVSTVSALLVGLVSALQGSKPGRLGSMKTDRATDRSFAAGFNVRSIVIGLQVALSLILLIPCGLFIRSALNASAMTTGFSTDRVLLLPISTEQSGLRVQKPDDFDQQLVERVALLPGVEVATLMDPVPLWFGGKAAFFSIESNPRQRIGYSVVAPKYFETLRLPLLRGRDFSRFDDVSAPRVAIVNETMARRFWPDGNTLGQRIRRGDVEIEIIGVAKDAKYRNLAETSQPWLYQPIAQESTNDPSLSLAVRTTADPMQLRTAIEREVKGLLPTWPSFQFRLLDEGLQLHRLLPRVAASLLGGLGVFGLFLAALGLYGVMALVVKQRTREIGIRLALGAPNASVVRLMIRQGMAVCLIGAAVGIAITFAVTQLLNGLLYGISVADPLTYVAVVSLLLAIAFLACYLPARHATKVNTLDVLRYE